MLTTYFCHWKKREKEKNANKTKLENVNNLEARYTAELSIICRNVPLHLIRSLSGSL